MSHQDYTQEDWMQAFAGEYLEKLYYFCLKKTGEPQEAEELSADVAEAVLSELNRGVQPDNFPAWVWRIARNRYSRWAASRHRQRQRLLPLDPEQPYPAAQLEDTLVSGEELTLLRRELAFAAREYREVLVAYYLEDRRIQEIAAGMGLPEGTIKARLFRARKRLKEGMDMARTFGARSYHPEDVCFAASGNQPSGLPWQAVERRLPKNLLLQAHNNPSTLEELAMELGIALPYAEEEVQLLVDATLLREVNGRYITNFFIADRDCQLAVYQAQRRESEERSRLLDELVSDTMDAVRPLGIMRNGMPDRDFKWLLVTMAADRLNNAVSSYAVWDIFHRPDGGNWGFMGLEQGVELPEDITMGHNGSGNDQDAMFFTYNYALDHMQERVGRMSYSQTLLLSDMLRHDRPLSSLTAAEQRLWNEIDGRFVHAEGDRVVPDIAVFAPGVQDQLFSIWASHPAYETTRLMVERLFEEVKNILRGYSNPILHEQLDYYVSMLMCDIRMMVIHDELAAGRLLLPDSPDTSTVSMYLEMHE